MFLGVVCCESSTCLQSRRVCNTVVVRKMGVSLCMDETVADDHGQMKCLSLNARMFQEKTAGVRLYGVGLEGL